MNHTFYVSIHIRNNKSNKTLHTFQDILPDLQIYTRRYCCFLVRECIHNIVASGTAPGAGRRRHRTARASIFSIKNSGVTEGIRIKESANMGIEGTEWVEEMHNTGAKDNIISKRVIHSLQRMKPISLTLPDIPTSFLHSLIFSPQSSSQRREKQQA